MNRHSEGATFEESSVASGGFRFRCLAAGRGEAVLRLHAADELELTRVDGMLAKAHRVIAIGLPRSGQSDRVARAIAGLARELGLERYSVIAGWSAAAVAVRLALDYGDWIEALVLLAPRLQPGIEAALRDLGVATLVVFGTKDELSAAGRTYRASMPNCSFALVYDAGEALESERPEAVAGLVEDFLERREVFVVSRESSLINP